MDWLVLLEKAFWCGCASFGFAILFNVPPRALLVIGVLGSLAGGSRTVVVQCTQSITLGALVGAAGVGLTSIWAAHAKHAPPLVFAIPAVIPLVPGAYAYKTMLGMLRLAGELEALQANRLLVETVHNGIVTCLGLTALALGVSAPMLLTRSDTAKTIKLPPVFDLAAHRARRKPMQPPRGS